MKRLIYLIDTLIDSLWLWTAANEEKKRCSAQSKIILHGNLTNSITYLKGTNWVITIPTSRVDDDENKKRVQMFVLFWDVS